MTLSCIFFNFKASAVGQILPFNTVTYRVCQQCVYSWEVYRIQVLFPNLSSDKLDFLNQRTRLSIYALNSDIYLNTRVYEQTTL